MHAGVSKEIIFILVIILSTHKDGTTASQRQIQNVMNYFSFDMRVCASLKRIMQTSPQKPTYYLN